VMGARLRFLVPEGTVNYVKNPSLRFNTDGWNVTAGTDVFEDNFDRADGPIGLPWIGSAMIVSNEAVIQPVMGAEIFDDPSFDTGIGWILGANAAIVAGELVYTAASGLNSFVSQLSKLTVGNWNHIILPIVAFTSGSGISPAAGVTNINPHKKHVGDNIWSFRALGTSASFKTRINLVTCKIDNVSIKELTLSSLFSSIETSKINAQVSVNLTIIAGTQAGLVTNLDDAATPDNFIIAYIDGTNINLDKCVGGVYTNLISVAEASLSANLQIKSYLSGSDLKVSIFVDGVQKGAEQTVSDAGIVGNTIHGMFSTYSENTFDTFRMQTWAEVNPSAAMFRTIEEARFGVSSLIVGTDGLANREGVYYRVNDLDGVESFVTGSAYLRGDGVVRIRLIDNPSGNEWLSDKVELLNDRWQRVEVLGRSSGSDDFRLYVETGDDLPQEIVFFVDGVQVECKDEATTYCDGDQPGCLWNLIAHGSVSSRNPTTRAGGRWIDIAGPKCEEQNLYMTVIGGMGMAPISNHIQDYADAPGAYYQSTKVNSRVITMSFFAKRKYKARTNKLPSLRALHKLRQELIDVVKTDRTAGGEAFTLEYSDGEFLLYLKVRYDGGLDGDWDVRNEFLNSFPLRLLAVSPFFTEDDQESDTLAFRTTQDINYILQRIDGEWSEMNGGFDDQVRALEVGTRGEIIAVGDFSLANNNAGAVDPMIFVNKIAYWDGSQWRGYGSGANDVVRAVAIAPNGNIYVCGDFTSIGGVAADRVAYWDGSAWNAMGAGLDDVGRAIKVAPNGDVYVGGDFVNAGGNPAFYIARWDGSWHSLGANGGMNAAVHSLAITEDGGSVYLGGEFTDEQTDPGILALNYVALYEPSFLSFDELGVGFDAMVRKLLVLPSGILYASGDFTESNDSELILLYMAYWNGASWFEIGVGADASVRDFDVSDFGSIVAGGDFTRIGSTDASYAALWNDSVFVNLDLQLAAPVFATVLDKMENVFLAPNGGNANFASITTIENVGSAETHPTVFIIGPCRLLWLENQTSKKRVYADLEIADSEEITIDFSKGTMVSNVRGNLAYAIEPGSDLRAWTLIPGENKIAVFMRDDVGARMNIYHTPRHWSADATARVEGL